VKRVILFLLLILYLEGSTLPIERFNLSLHNDEEGVRPVFTLPLYSTQDFITTLAYESGKSSKINTVNDSISETSFRNKNIYNTLTFDMLKNSKIDSNTYYSWGLSGRYQSNEIIQNGNSNIVASNETVKLDSTTNSTLYELGLHADITTKNYFEGFHVRSGVTLFPLIYSTVEESKSFTPIIAEKGHISSSKAQSLQYSLFLTMQAKIIESVSLLLDLKYHYLPMEVAALGIGQNGAALFFTESSYQSNAILTQSKLKFLFHNVEVYGVLPSLGIEYKTQDLDVKNSDDTTNKSSVKQTVLTFGFDKIF
jgi:hypothetical protein